jgi:hypothetical protein
MATRLRQASAGLLCCLLALLVPASSSYAAAPATPVAPARTAAPPAARSPVVPAPIVALALVRSVMLAVDQANKTGNYTVLRDLGSPNFRAANDAARLAQIFATIRAQGVDLLATAVVEPIYKEPPRLTEKRMLYIAGQFPIAPRPVRFELLFEVEAGQWRLYGVSIAPA